MATNAISGLSMALYRDDPTAASVVFTSIALVDAGDHMNWQIAAGTRYWDSTQTLTIEKQTHGTGGWNAVTPDQIYWASGKVYFATALNSDDLVRATGKRRAEANFIKVINLYKVTLKVDGKTIDISSVDSGGWEECLAGNRSFEGSCEAFFYYNISTQPYVDIRDFLTSLYAKFYSNYSGSVAWTGLVEISNTDIIMNMNEAQKKTLTFKGTRELFQG